MFKNLPEIIPATSAITTTDISPSGRAMFMGRQCMAYECMREAIGGRGMEAHFCSIEDQITKQMWDYDIFVMFLMKYEPGMPSLIQMRMNEVRACMPRIPTMALLEDADADAATLHQFGFSTIIMGLPSLNFAITAIQLLSLGANTIAATDVLPATPAVRVRQCQDLGQTHSLLGQTHSLDAMLADVTFTNRELELIDLLCGGMQNKVMAHRLGISESTVKAHLRNIMTKLHARNRTHAIFMLTHDMMHRTPIDGCQRLYSVRSAATG